MSDENKGVCPAHAHMSDDIKEIKLDVKDLLSFKSKILGIIGLVTFITTIVMDIVKDKI